MKLSIKAQGHSLTLVKGHSDFKVKYLTFGMYTQVSNSGPHGPLVVMVIASLRDQHFMMINLLICNTQIIAAMMTVQAISKDFSIRAKRRCRIGKNYQELFFRLALLLTLN